MVSSGLLKYMGTRTSASGRKQAQDLGPAQE